MDATPDPGPQPGPSPGTRPGPEPVTTPGPAAGSHGSAAATSEAIDELEHRSSWLGIITTLAVAVPVLVAQVTVSPDPLVDHRVGWWTSWLAFVAGMLAMHREWPRRHARLAYRIALVVMVGSGLVAVALSPLYGFSVVLPIVAASSASFVVGFRPAIALVVGQAVVITGIYLSTPGVDTGQAVLQGVAWGGFMGFAVFTVEAADRQHRAGARLAAVNDELAATNVALARTNAELEDAQRQLAASSRTAERLRISRDLHDLIGHQLTALTLQLETASHRGVGPATDNVDRARTIARDMLVDVRDVVGRLREDDPRGHSPATVTADHDRRARLAGQLREAVDAVASLQVDLDLQEAALPVDDARATALVRMVQEIVTNAARHAEADHLWIRVEADGRDVVLTAHDDGHGAPTLEPGHGLLGMQERMEAFGGTVRTWTPHDGGLHLRATIPTVAVES